MREWEIAFTGIRPIVEPHLLEPGQSVVADNCDFDRGSIVARRGVVSVATPAKPGTKLSIYRFGKDLDSDSQYWFHWTADTDVTRGPVPDDPGERTYFTERGQPPRVTDSALALTDPQLPAAWRRLGLPQPEACSISVTGNPTGTTPATRIFVTYTFVNEWGEEGPPAVAPSNGADWQPGQTLHVTGMQTAVTGEYAVTHKRIYVAITASTGETVFKFWAQVALATPNYSAELVTTQLAERLQEPYLLPPREDLFGIMAHPNGFLVAFSGKRVCRSEVHRPYGWPSQYEDPVDHDIVGGAILRSSTIIFTKAEVRICHAIDPLDWSIGYVDGAPPCQSKRSIAKSPGGVFYASTDGVGLITAEGVGSVITRDILSKEQWQAFKPESMLGVFFDGQYIVFYNTGSLVGSLIFDWSTKTITTCSLYATAAYVDPRRNELFLQVGNNIVKFEAGTPLTARRRSRELVTPLVTMCAGRVVSTAYPVTYRLFADGVLRHTQIVNNRQAFPMPAGYTARSWSWEVEFTGDARIQEGGFAEHLDEFREERLTG